MALQSRGSVVGAVVMRGFVCFWYFGVPEAIYGVFHHVTVLRPRVMALIGIDLLAFRSSFAAFYSEDCVMYNGVNNRWIGRPKERTHGV